MTLTLAMLVACAALSLTAVALLAVLLRRRKRETLREVDATRQLEAAIELLDKKLNGANILTSDELTPIAGALGKLGQEVRSIARLVEKAVTAPEPDPAPVPAPTDPVALEHQVLGEAWKQFRGNRELSASFNDALQDRAWAGWIDQLAALVPTDLKPTFDAVTGPCREYRTLLQKLELIPRVVSGEFPRLATDAEEVRRTRELASLLTSEAANRLDFRFKSWVTDTFLPFADLYLQRGQQATLEKRGGEPDAGFDLVRRLLRAAAVEPIHVTPGETPFDSTRHIGRSTTNDPRFADGVITGVVRNGFIEGGQQVLRQPEVIVNRMR
jgi:hypothetical protein